MARMKVLLIEDVPNLGLAGEIHTVAAGFARNYLMPRKEVVPASKGAVKQSEDIRQSALRKRAKERSNAEAQAAMIGKQKLIFRKAKPGEPHDIIKDDANVVPTEWRATQHEQLLADIAEIGREIASLRGTKSALRDQLSVLEARKQEKWDAIRALWAGDGGWHKLNGLTNGNGKSAGTPVAAQAE